MSGLLESASAIMAASGRRIDVASLNVANVSTTGYKRQVAVNPAASFDAAVLHTRSSMERGKEIETGNPLDLSIRGEGYFQVRDGDQIRYSRQGSFRLAVGGSVITPQGYVLQQSGGGDLILESDAVQISDDGTVLSGDRPIARIATFQTEGIGQSTDGAYFTFDDGPIEADRVSIRQGSLESSNVAVGDEMVTMMAALRQAEGGARLVQTYDELLGRAITSFGQGGR